MIQVEFESNVRSYCRSFPDVFDTAEGALVLGIKGRHYLDFLSGCGSLNYGHNHPSLQEALLSYIGNNGIAMSLDMETRSKNEFMEVFAEHILRPRGLDYKFQFPGPTGTNAVEAAIDLVRKFTGRSSIIAFTNAFHGCSLGALALTGNRLPPAPPESTRLQTEISTLGLEKPMQLLLLGERWNGCEN